MKTLLTPSDLLAMEPRLLVALNKATDGKKGRGGWSDTARAAATAARKAKTAGVNPDAAKGKSVDEV